MKKVILAGSIGFFLAGCSGGAANCNDSGVKQSVMSTIESNIQKALWGKDLYDKGLVSNSEISSVKEISNNKEVDSYTCAANFAFDLNGNPQSIPVTYRLSYLEDQNDTEVSVYGVDLVKARMMSLAMFGR
ncbi:hypothetical protein KC131_26875 [Pseudomonas sp. JQ170]|uniref:hypothetical protein n=1 Tax=unclassified Pseudomonas TaxID=196821 RepID=UPI002652A7D5|nr:MULTISPECIES: hypothetical protein [unclassified Pseudomonas]MDN7144272.1 hypothetical protein [Pseudomonas sp. JQ170]WRO74173.1 hypothetical protein U9R80_16755 [Pseudomonas sp. 170C]